MSGHGELDRESERLDDLCAYRFLYDHRKVELERLCLITKQLLGGNSASVTLVYEDEIRFLSSEGAPMISVPRAGSFCDVAIGQTALFEVPDVVIDPCFSGMHAHHHLRHYAGVPLAPTLGVNLGTLCVVGFEPRELTPDQRRTLISMAAVVEDQMRLYRTGQALREREQLLAQARDDAEAANRAKSEFASVVTSITRPPRPPRVPAPNPSAPGKAGFPNGTEGVTQPTRPMTPQMHAHCWSFKAGTMVSPLAPL